MTLLAEDYRGVIVCLWKHVCALQHKQEKAIIPSILSSSGETVHNPQEIDNVFKTFYNQLY